MLNAKIKIAFLQRPYLNANVTGLASILTSLGAAIIGTKEHIDGKMVRPSLYVPLNTEMIPIKEIL